MTSTTSRLQRISKKKTKNKVLKLKLRLFLADNYLFKRSFLTFYFTDFEQMPGPFVCKFSQPSIIHLRLLAKRMK